MCISEFIIPVHWDFWLCILFKFFQWNLGSFYILFLEILFALFSCGPLILYVGTYNDILQVSATLLTFLDFSSICFSNWKILIELFLRWLILLSTETWHWWPLLNFSFQLLSFVTPNIYLTLFIISVFSDDVHYWLKHYFHAVL